MTPPAEAPTAPPRIGSLCSGYGGLDLAVAAHHGASVAWHAEVDRHANRVLEARWPGLPNLGDLTRVDWAAVDPVDILTAGYPCQPFSTAGNRRGKNDPRHLWPHIADAISILRPRRIVLENVAGHLRLGFADVLADLTRMGFDARWGIVRASDAGAPHRRARLFVVADADGVERYRPRNPAGCGEHESSDGGGIVADPYGGGCANGDRCDAAGGADLDDGASPDPGRRQFARPPLGDNGLRVPGERRHNLLPTPTVVDQGRGRTVAEWDDWTAAMRARHGNGNGHGPSLSVEAHRLGEYGPAVDRWAAILGRPAPDPLQHRADARPRLNPAFVEWLMGLPAGWVTGVPGVPHSQQLKLLGNGVVPAQAALALAALDGLADG